MLSLTAWAIRVPVGLATPALVVGFTLVQAAGLTLGQVAVPTLALAAVPTLALAVVHPQAQGEVAMLALVGSPRTNGTDQIQTVSDACN